MVFTPKPRPPITPHPSEESRWSGEHLIPSNGYSSLFTSGLMRSKTPQPTSPTQNVVPFPRAQPYVRPSPPRPPRKRGSPSKVLSSPNRRRPSALPSSPGKTRANAAAADRALTDVMHKLRLYAGTSISPQKQSRWSLSSEESRGSGEGGSGHWPARPSGESVRSQRSRTTLKSKKSAWSLRSRKSEDGERPSFGLEDAPPMPEPIKMAAHAQAQMPTTPGRGRRVVEGLARRLGLTPKKKKGRELVTPSRPETPAAYDPLPSLPLPPLPNLTERTLPKKGSMTILRTLAKKTSTGTLRSVRSIRSIYGQASTDLPPALPPTTPRRTMPKSSIGPPKAQRAAVSPSAFDSVPRLAPKTPERQDDLGVRGGIGEAGDGMDVDEVITFAAALTPARHGAPHAGSPHTPQPYAIATQPVPLPGLETPCFANTTAAADVAQPSPKTPSAAAALPAADFTDASEFLTSTPVSQQDQSFHSARSAGSGRTTPLTVKAVHAQAQHAKTPSKPRRLLDLLPTYSRLQNQHALAIGRPGSTDENANAGSAITPKSKIRTPWRKKSVPSPGGIPLNVQGKDKHGIAVPRLGSTVGVLSARSDRANIMSMYDPSARTLTGSPAPDHKPIRPATSQGHRRDYLVREEDRMPYPPDRQFHHDVEAYSTFGTNAPPPKSAPQRHHRRPRVPDFSRPMSKQDLSMSMSISASASASTSFSAPERAESPFLLGSGSDGMRMGTEADRADITMDADTPASAETAQTSYFSSVPATGAYDGGGVDGVGVPTASGGGHGRMDSKDSFLTSNSCHTAHTTHTARTAHTATSESSGVGHWDLERYLNQVETDQEDDDKASLGLGASYEESLASYVTGSRPGTRAESRGGEGKTQGKATIQHARYGIRI